MSCGTGFITASEAKVSSRDNRTIFSEICGLQQSILTSIDAKQMETYVTSGTPMTNDTTNHDYYKVFIGQATNRALQDQIEFVKSYFVDLGYAVKMQVNPNTQNTVQWYITW